jgi:cell division protein FtsW
MIIMFLLGLSVIWMGGANKIWFGLAGGVAVVAVMVVLTISEYARTRLDVWLHPENYDTLDETWQTLNGLYAVGSGGFFGVGLGNSRQKHLYVSEPQNDFIFSIICEELGFVGAVIILLLFAFLLVRGIHVAMRAKDRFGLLLVTGVTAQVILQALLNIMVVTGTIPYTGITLPFFSYGGTALSLLLAEMGLVLSVSRQANIRH